MKGHLMKHFLTAMILATTFGVSAPAWADNQGNFPDVSQSHWAAKALQELATKHKVQMGYPDGTFRGDRAVTRYEMAAMFLKVLNNLKGKDTDSSDHMMMKRLKAEFAKELENMDERLEELQDQIDMLDVRNMEANERLWHSFEKDLPFRLSGDVAIRHELVTPNLSDFSAATTNTPQTRLTLSLNSRHDEDSIFDYGARLSVGNRRNPGQPWWRLGDYFARVELGFDRFFITYRPWEPLGLTVGKFQNKLSNSEIFYDFDIQPEGAMQELSFKEIAPWFQKFSLLAGETIINMNQNLGGNVFMLSGKADADFNFGNFVSLDLSGGYHQYFGTEHLLNVTQLAQDAGVSPRLVGMENRNDEGTNFQIANGFGKLTFHLAEGWPLSVEGDYLYNLAASSDNQAYQLGATLGSARLPGQVSLGYKYKMLQKNATVSYFVEDQLGGTDIMAHEGFFKVKVWDKTTLFATGQASQRLSGDERPMVYTLRAGVHQSF